MPKKLNIGFTFDAKRDYEKIFSDKEKIAEFDSEETLSEIESALRSGGHQVERIGQAFNLLKQISSGKKWDIVFNIAEGISGRNRESQVPVILEMFGQPYVGSDGLTMGITLDKSVAKRMVSSAGLNTPEFFVAEEEKFLPHNINYPVIVKPLAEGTSKGLTSQSLVNNRQQLLRQIKKIFRRFQQPAIVERFIIGEEFTVVVLGPTNRPEVFPPVQISLKGKTYLGKEFYTHRRVENDEIHYLCPAPARKSLLKKISEMAEVVYSVLGCRDFARIDIRTDRKGQPYFLECNPLPNLGKIDVFPLVASAAGISYNEIILRILEYARKRYNI